jgi:FAD/FMN-containing dehydrogenase
MMEDANFNFKHRLAGVMKPEYIIDQPERLKEYSQDYSFMRGSCPFLTVFPESRDKIQAIVKLAGESSVPLIPMSSGPPHFHRDTITEAAGIIKDLSRMNRIEVDPILRTGITLD